jgi:transcriptional regulator with XRE-family HTH domain
MDTAGNVSVRDVVSYRVQELRKRRGLTGRQLADKCAAAGAAHITRDFVTSLETRRRGVSVDDVLVLAYVLDVAPLVLLGLSESRGEVVTLTDSVRVADAEQWRNWLVGDAALEGSDSRLYYGSALERMEAPGGQAMSAYARAVVLERHRELAAHYDKQAHELLDRTRTQMRAFVDDLAAEVAAGGSAEQVLARLDGIRSRIVRPLDDGGAQGG